MKRSVLGREHFIATRASGDTTRPEPQPLLGQALRLPVAELDAALGSTTDLLYHALFADSAPKC